MLKKVLILVALILLITTNYSFAQENTQNKNKLDPNKTDEITKKYGFTLQEEREIGLQSAIILATKRYKIYNDTKLTDYINKVGQSLAKKVTKRPDISYNFFILDTPEINAFAIPGGFIFITKGALKVLDNEAELAGILAHEIAHVEEGHGLEAIASNPAIREKLNVMKTNLEAGKGLTQQSLKTMLSKEKNLTEGIVNSGKMLDIKDINAMQKGDSLIITEF